MTALLQRFFNVRREEVLPLLVSTFFFFCVLSAIMVMRPARDALGSQRGLDEVQWLFIGTALATLAVNPIFGWMVSRFRRMTFISMTYSFFAVSLVAFYMLLTMTPEAVGATTARVYYVWHSVFNLFCTAVFWALMADRYSLEQSKRLFGVIAVGGTLGAIVGPWLAGLLAVPFGTASLLLVAAGFLVAAIIAAWIVTRLQPERAADAPPADDKSVIGGSAWEGIRAVFQSRYLLGISGYMLLVSITMTYLYFTRLRIVDALGTSVDTKAEIFAHLDLVTQVSTLVMQTLVAGHFMKRFGVAAALITMPVVVAGGFIGLAIAGSYAALVLFESSFRAVRYAIMQPARHTLFTVVSREDKYKSKAFIDTFVYRGGDLIGAWTQGFLVNRLGPYLATVGLGLTASLVALASVAVPLTCIWAVLGLWLGRQQQRQLAASQADESPTSQSVARPVSLAGQNVANSG